MTDPAANHFLALPQSGKGPGVLVLHPWWGLNDFIRGFCDRLAQDGFVALAPDMFAGKVARTIEDAEEIVTQLNWEQDVPPRILPAVEALRQHPGVTGTGLGIVGFSFGAFWALWLAQQQPALVRAVTLFYGTNEGDFQHSHAAFQGHFAENDPNEPTAAVEALEKRLRDAHRPTTFYTYPGTGHWFFEDDRPDAYNAPSAQLAWERTTAFLHEQLSHVG
jgi:carboxymethylenebutenolidase